MTTRITKISIENIRFFKNKVFPRLSLQLSIVQSWQIHKVAFKSAEYLIRERIVRSRRCGKPAFFLNTFPKASPLNVCILLCIPVCDFRNDDRPRKEIHYRHSVTASRRKNGLAVSRRNMILAFAIRPSSRDVEDLNHTAVEQPIHFTYYREYPLSSCRHLRVHPRMHAWEYSAK